MNYQTGTTTAARTAPDQSIRARHHINVALAESGIELIDAVTARIIAATVHGGYRTALCNFAATGILSGNVALAELRAVPSTQLAGTWRKAFTNFVIAAGSDSDE
ncbi:hypothetical protein [Glaciihabitans sp. UYNi722]|uniref:hypothetical protein n=1 Tax=Glaciihabitans sp. UYNi722 TaxID=3156344 RepID=UPI0033973925